MRAQVIVRLVLLALSLTLADPGLARAQRSTIPPIAISEAGDCINAALQTALRDEVYTPEIDGGWQIVMPLRGQPNANRGAQSLPPASDADFVLDVFAVGSEAELPGDLDPFSDFAVKGGNGIVWYARSSGYFWLVPSTTARDCFRRVTDGQMIVG